MGSSNASRRWDARKLRLEENSVDLVVSDLPFLNRCDFNFHDDPGGGPSARVGLSSVVRELSRVLRPTRRTGGPGQAILLVQSRHIFEDALKYSEGCGLRLQDRLPNPRPVVIGGAACWVFLLQQGAFGVEAVERNLQHSSRVLLKWQSSFGSAGEYLLHPTFVEAVFSRDTGATAAPLSRVRLVRWSDASRCELQISVHVGVWEVPLLEMVASSMEAVRLQSPRSSKAPAVQSIGAIFKRVDALVAGSVNRRNRHPSLPRIDGGADGLHVLAKSQLGESLLEIGPQGQGQHQRWRHSSACQGRC
eukprot:s1841_g9.t1